ncbi:hypothetical protein TTHERM_000253466 (macronuclear) [Tetrahymena thermophila SB210]|uniref:Uncharacterized protein n=1 Tax=Tetrahymena thermophila (strain SB210) TaxID=312017 RepID=W7XIU4_TETTS|nr:hypothetical protein TTHERM_000253466 [Tetrahymena thermophila SB210]EWS73614.1 hypothetical protein TTHERM_000253466 [Tetrahymena thermophila SB210]|eukprot:XP_012653844.1 hypothetical protein TTHERM_000253466 [Tetrahymena thermophila SB210]
MENSANKRNPNSYEKKQKIYYEQEQDEIFSKYPFFHQGIPDLPQELYPLPKRRMNYKIDELQQQDNKGRQRRRSSNMITEEIPIYLNFAKNNGQQDSSEERYLYPQFTKKQLKDQERNLCIANEQKKQTSQKVKDEKETKKKAYQQYLEQMNDKMFDQVVEMTKIPEKKIQINMDEQDISIELVNKSDIRRKEEGDEAFYEKERNLLEKKRTLKQKLVDKFKIRLNFEAEEFLDKNVYDFYNKQQINEIKSLRKQSLELNPYSQQNGINKSNNKQSQDNKVKSLYTQQKNSEGELPSSLQQQISKNHQRKFNSLQTSPRMSNIEQSYLNQQIKQDNNQVSIQALINQQKNEQNILNYGQSSYNNQNILNPIIIKNSTRNILNNSQNYNIQNNQNQLYNENQKIIQQSQQCKSSKSVDANSTQEGSIITSKRFSLLKKMNEKQFDSGQISTLQDRFKNEQTTQLTESSPKVIQLKTSPGKRFREESPFLTSTVNQQIQTTQNEQQKPSKSILELPINQYHMPTEASQQYSPNANERSGNLSPFLYQSSSRNSSQFPLISIKNNNHRINSSFSRYKVVSPHSNRNNMYSFSKENSNSSILQQSGEALEALKKENQKLLNSKYTRQHAQIINSIRKKSMQIEQSMKETDESFQQLVSKVKNEQVKILTNLNVAKAPQSVQIKLINDFQNILSVYGAQLN